jgi:hypothetical protein
MHPLKTQPHLRLFSAAAMLLAGSLGQGALIAHYQFDEISGTAAVNQVTASGHDGAIGANVTLGVAGVAGTAFTFSGGATQADIVDMANATGVFTPILASGQFTLSYWIKSTDTGNRNVAVFMGNNTASNDYIDSGVLGSNQFAPAGSTYGRNRVATNTPANIGDLGGGALVNDGVFHHIAFSIDKATSTGAFYVDGSLAQTVTSANFANFPTLNNLEVGRLGRSSPTDGLAGTIDDLQIYDHVLSLAEVQFLHANPGLAVPEPGAAALLAAGLGLASFRRRVAQDAEPRL